MKRVKKQKTRVQKYQNYVNKKIAAVCAMTLSMSVLLSPFATSANNPSYPILISSVSEELTKSDDYVNVALSYHDIEETQLSVTMDVTVNLDNVVTDQEQTEVVDDLNENSQETSAIKNPVESSDSAGEYYEPELTNEIIEEENPVIDEQVESSENTSAETGDASLEETDNKELSDEEASDMVSETIEESHTKETDLIEGEEINQEESKTLEPTGPIATVNMSTNKKTVFTSVTSVLNQASQWVTNVFKYFTTNHEVVVEAADVQEKSIVLDFPIHSSFSLDESTLKILGANGEELSTSSLEVNTNHLTLGFAGEIPEQFNVSFLLNRSEAIQSGQVVVNEGSMIRYNIKGEGETKEITFPTMNVNLYELTQIMALPTLESSFYQANTISDESGTETSSSRRTVPLNNGNTLYLDKTATDKGDGSYLIKLNTSGVVQSTTTVKKADIVLVVDKSGSMEDKMTAIKSSIHDFISQLLSLNTTNNSDSVRVAIVTYSSSAENLLDGFISTYDNNAISKINNINADGATNTEGGIEMAGQLLTQAATENGRSDAQQYVVFFTDGFPTRSSSFSISGSTPYVRHFKAAQIAYYSNFSGKLTPDQNGKITVGTMGIVSSLWPDRDQSESYTPTSSPLDAKFYSIGLFVSATSEEKTMAVEFLKTIQNVVKMEDYGAKYYTDKINDAQKIYSEILKEIKTEIKGNLLTTVTITDIVPDYLDIVEGSFNINPTSTVGKTLTWNFENLTEDGIELSFKVIPNDPYLGGTNIPTNVSATIKANEINKLEGESYPVPEIDITPIQGGIKIDKQVINSDRTPFTTDEKFTINITRMKGNLIQEQLGFNVAGNNVDETVSFYLKGQTTNISFNDDKTKNYLTVGTYSVDEVVPANYRKDSVSIKVCPNANYNTDANSESCSDAVVDANGRFTIDKNNRYILIIVKNKLANENYWYDKEHIPNRFTYINDVVEEITLTK